MGWKHGESSVLFRVELAIAPFLPMPFRFADEFAKIVIFVSIVKAKLRGIWIIPPPGRRDLRRAGNYNFVPIINLYGPFAIIGRVVETESVAAFIDVENVDATGDLYRTERRWGTAGHLHCEVGNGECAVGSPWFPRV